MLTSQTGKNRKGRKWQDTALVVGRCIRRYGLSGEPFGTIYHNRNVHSLYSAVLLLKTPPADSVFNSLANLLALRNGCPSVNPTPDGSFRSHILGSWVSFHLGSEHSDFLHCDSLVSVFSLFLLIVLIDSINWFLLISILYYLQMLMQTCALQIASPQSDFVFSSVG